MVNLRTPLENPWCTQPTNWTFLLFYRKFNSLKRRLWRSRPFGLTDDPLFPHTAAASYTSIYNLLDLPAGVVPVHRVSEADEAELRNNYDTEHDFSLIRARRSCLGALGMPVSAQIVGRPYEEELVLRLMKEVEESSDYVQPMLLHEKSSLRVVEGKEMQ